MIHPAEQAVVQHAQQRGFLTRAQLDAALAQLEAHKRAGLRANLLHLLTAPLSPAQRDELKVVYQQALAGDATLAPQVRPNAPPPPGPPPTPGQVGAAREEATIGPQPIVPPRFQLPVAPPPLMQGGAQIGPYRIVKELARGGMGVVFIAEHTQLGRQVALKTLIAAPGMAKSPQVGRFLVEARAAARLRHPNIVAVHDVGVADGRHYLSMDLIAGESLKDRLNTLDYLDPHRAAEITRDLARALEYAHQQNVLHRDLKPANILLRAGDDAPLLTDFGLAKLVEDSHAFTRTGEMMGTAHYMPPEQARGDKTKISPKSDVYGLGATLYHLLTGRPPFQGATLHIVLGALLAGELTPPSQVVPSVPQDLSAVCLKCLERDPDQRYGSMAELADDLERFLAGEPVRAQARRRGRGRLLAVILLPLLLLGGWLLSREEPAKSTTAPPQPTPAADRAPEPNTGHARKTRARGGPTKSGPESPHPRPRDSKSKWLIAKKVTWIEHFDLPRSPSKRWGHSLVYDAARGETILFGGRIDTELYGDTWSWNGTRWRKLKPTRAPSPRFGHSVTYDRRRGRIVLYGGSTRLKDDDVGASYSDMWEWDGRTWHPIAYGQPGPGPRAEAPMTDAPDLGKLLLHGGKDERGRSRSDLWSWSGEEWALLTATSPAGPRSGHSAGYHEERRALVLFGDRDRWRLRSDETFEWRRRTWRRLGPRGVPRAPHGRLGAPMAYAGGQLLLLGGFGGKFLSGLWRWDGTHWLRLKRRPGIRGLRGRCWTPLAYDSRRKTLIVFGGLGNGNQPLGDTWEYSGPLGAGAFEPSPPKLLERPRPWGQWIERKPKRRPPPRWAYGAAYDASRGLTILHGGIAYRGSRPQGRRSTFGDTWAWDGSDWRQLHTKRSPSPRYGQRMAYDAARQRIVLFGGAELTAPSGWAQRFRGDLWEWDGEDWVQIPFEGEGPGPRALHGMVYAPDLQQVLVFGGVRGNQSLGDLWAWDGRAWSQPRAVAGRGGRRFDFGAAYDRRRRTLVLFGSRRGRQPPLDRVLEWNAQRWSKHAGPANEPRPRSRQVTGFVDDGRGILMFGGNAGGPLADTWDWTGTRWRKLRTLGAPEGRFEQELVWDSRRKVVVMFGGVAGPGTGRRPLGDTWEFRRSPWAERHAARRPPTRWQFGMAYDARRKVTLLFGGQDHTKRIHGDTWTWDGSEWRARTPKRRPSPRYGHDMAYDPARGRIVLYGGRTPTENLSDLWEWDGEDWVQIAFEGGPGPRVFHAMTYAPDLKQVLLLAGRAVKPPVCDLWGWDGKAWSKLPTRGPRAAPRHLHTGAYDPRRRTLVSIGAWRREQPTQERWALEWSKGAFQRLTLRGQRLPPALMGASLVVDDRSPLLFGGWGNRYHRGLWRWNGKARTWSEVQPLSKGLPWPAARCWHRAVWDSEREVMVVFGGKDAKNESLDDTWEYSPSVPRSR